MNQVGQDSFLKCCPDIQSCTFLKDGVQIASGTYPHLGPYYVTPGYVFISGIKEERLFLQIMILMIKDTMVAWLCSEISFIGLIDRADDFVNAALIKLKNL